MTTPVVFTTLESARAYANIPPDYCSYVLIKAKPGASPRKLAADVRQLVPYANVYTAREFRSVSQDYWMQRTGIGLSFGAATALGLLVGLLMVMQSLYALSLDHLREYAALKAIGADDAQVAQVVRKQALSIATVGSAVGVGLVLVLERAIASPIAPIEIPNTLLVGSVTLVFGLCLVATSLPLLRIRRVDPAIVLQG
jgi:putative ABC transport system permease protein